MNKRNEALADLKCAIELDPDYIELAKNDKDFEKLWEDKDFINIVTANKSINKLLTD